MPLIADSARVKSWLRASSVQAGGIDLGQGVRGPQTVRSAAAERVVSEARQVRSPRPHPPCAGRMVKGQDRHGLALELGLAA